MDFIKSFWRILKAIMILFMNLDHTAIQHHRVDLWITLLVFHKVHEYLPFLFARKGIEEADKARMMKLPSSK